MWQLQVTLTALFLASFATCYATNWQQTTFLDADRKVTLSWSVDNDTSSITFNLTAVTNGWVGVGFNSKGSMVGADIVVGWVGDDGQTKFSDRHADANALPEVDASQDYELLESSETGNVTTLIFQRAFDSCDDDDYLFERGTTSVLYAYGEEDPEGDDPSYHQGNRGSKSLLLLDPPPVKFPDDGSIRTIEFVMPSVTIPHKTDTTYWCTFFRGPSLETKHQYIGNEPIVAKGSENHFHHFIVYECSPKDDSDVEYFEQLLEDYPGGYDCFAPESPMDFRWDCLDVRVAWATGGLGEAYPPEAGYPIPTADQGPVYYFMETHYDNQELAEGIVDTSGVRLYYTDQLRPHDIGIFLVSMPVHYTQLLPPNVEEFVSVGHASPLCTERHIPEEGINVFGILQHSHLTGRKMKTRLFRNGKEEPWLLNDNHYDFSYQQTRILPEHRKIYPGDQITTECFLATNDRKEVTLGGLRTVDEMCESFLLYYPAMELRFSESSPTQAYIDEVFGFYNTSIGWGSMNYLVGDTPMDVFLEDFDWNNFDVERYQQETRFGVHSGSCITKNTETAELDIPVSYPEDFEEYEEPPRQCPA